MRVLLKISQPSINYEKVNLVSTFGINELNHDVILLKCDTHHNFNVINLFTVEVDTRLNYSKIIKRVTYFKKTNQKLTY